ncbi:MAG: histone deacetylase [Actinobacteria bacterium]|nr:histone deacetylase [Actinomycetota bacterium]
MDALKVWKFQDSIGIVNPYPAGPDQIGMVHIPSYIEKIRRLSEEGGFHWLDPDTGLNRYTYESAAMAAGGIFKGLDLILGSDMGPGKFFAAVRPPGHHAFPGRGSGFCIFNNIALGAKYAQSKFKIKKIAIIDFDAHHGNGTQDIFYEDRTVFYISFHQYPHYPGTGTCYETGAGKGSGYNLNFPFAAHTGGPDYIAALTETVIPLMEKFKPGLIMVSAGYDSHYLDPLSSLELGEDSYYKISAILGALSNKHCQGKMAFVLEGGYNYRATADSILETLRGCLNFPYPEKFQGSEQLEEVLEITGGYDIRQIKNPFILKKNNEMAESFGV